MIKSFNHKGLRIFFIDGIKKGIQAQHADKLERILDRLNAAANIKDMQYPGSKLHLLEPKQDQIWAVTVSGNWRVTFRFSDGDAYIVDYKDYHKENIATQRKGWIKMRARKRAPIHPGRILLKDYIEPLDITITSIAEMLGVSRKAISAIANERKSITPGMALRLSRAFSTTPELWLNMQKNYDLWHAARDCKEWKNVKPVSQDVCEAVAC